MVYPLLKMVTAYYVGRIKYISGSYGTVLGKLKNDGDKNIHKDKY